MSTEIITAIIAFSGVVISIVASITVSLRQTTIELRKVRTEIQQTYMNKLLEKRIEKYPSLYKLLSDFDKSIRYGNLRKKDVDELFKKILAWDSENAIFLSGQAVKTYVAFRIVLSKVVKLSEKDFHQNFIINNEKKQLLAQANEVEVALKNDLGIFVVEFPDTDKGIRSYQEANVMAEKKK